MANRYTRQQVHDIAKLYNFVHYSHSGTGFEYTGEALTKMAQAGIKKEQLPVAMEEDIGSLLDRHHQALEAKRQREAQKEAAKEVERKRVEAEQAERSARDDDKLRATIRQSNPALTDAEVETILPEFKKQIALDRALQAAKRSGVNPFTAN